MVITLMLVDILILVIVFILVYILMLVVILILVINCLHISGYPDTGDSLSSEVLLYLLQMLQ